MDSVSHHQLRIVSVAKSLVIDFDVVSELSLSWCGARLLTVVDVVFVPSVTIMFKSSVV